MVKQNISIDEVFQILGAKEVELAIVRRDAATLSSNLEMAMKKISELENNATMVVPIRGG